MHVIALGLEAAFCCRLFVGWLVVRGRYCAFKTIQTKRRFAWNHERWFIGFLYCSSDRQFIHTLLSDYSTIHYRISKDSLNWSRSGQICCLAPCPDDFGHTSPFENFCWHDDWHFFCGVVWRTRPQLGEPPKLKNFKPRNLAGLTKRIFVNLLWSSQIREKQTSLTNIGSKSKTHTHTSSLRTTFSKHHEDVQDSL